MIDHEKNNPAPAEESGQYNFLINDIVVETENRCKNKLLGLQDETGDAPADDVEDTNVALSRDETLETIKPADSDDKKNDNQFIQVLDLINGFVEGIFHDQHRRTWIRYQGRNLEINSNEFRRLILKVYVDLYQKPFRKETAEAVGDYLGAKELEVFALYNRFAWLEDTLVIDIGDKDWQVAEVTVTGWQIIIPERSPFKRFGHHRPLPMPEDGGQVADILRFLPLRNERTKILCLVWVVTAFVSHIPRPGVILHGLQGSGKTSSAEMLRNFIDPSVPCTLSLSKDYTEFVQLMDHHAIINLDNLRSLPQWASDGLCRAVTGGGHSKRKHYTNDSDFTYEFQRTFILNGISVPSNAPDLIDRSILIELDRLPERERSRINEIRTEFEQARPKIFGAILDALVGAIRIHPSISLDRYPRMADWTGWACAVAEAIGIGQDSFLKAYYESINFQHEEIVASEPVCIALEDFMRDKHSWAGTATELLSAFNEISVNSGLGKTYGWPKAPNSLSTQLKKLSHNLEATGIHLEFGRQGPRRPITIRKVDKVPETSSQSSHRHNGNNTDDIPMTILSPKRDDLSNTANIVTGTVTGNPLTSLMNDDHDGHDGLSGTQQARSKSQLNLVF